MVPDSVGAQVSATSVSCLGSQLSRLLAEVGPYLTGTWFAADVSTNNSSLWSDSYSGSQLGTCSRPQRDQKLRAGLISGGASSR